jgi:Rad3-related DNA helicase
MHRRNRRTAQKLDSIEKRVSKGEWVIEPHGQTWAFNPVWVSEFAEDTLFHATKKVVLTSATCTRKTAEMLGIDADDLLLHEAPSDFPVERRPVYFHPAAKIDFRATESEIRYWLATIDNILRRREDRKGIIHAVSYARAKQIKDYSAFGHRMIVHDSRGTRDAVAEFRAAGPGAILVSPSVTTGYDFAGDQCEYQIIVKIPFPDRRDPVTAARTAKDATYPSYIAMQELVQAVGRGMRSADDQCETLIVDANCSWFMRKAGELAPFWFRQAYRRVDTLPDPLPKL